MKKVDLTAEPWPKAEIVSDFFKQETTCLDADKKLLVDPKYVVALGNDAVSSYYAIQIVLKAQRQFGSFPRILFCGGTGPLSKYLNIDPEGCTTSDGEKLHYVARCISLQLTQEVSILDKTNDLRDNLKELADFVARRNDSEAPIIFCPTQRVSKYLERTVAFMPKLFPDTAPLNAYYYVPGETLEQVLQLYNGKGLAGGLPLLAELAALYDKLGTDRYAEKYMKPMDKPVPPEVKEAGEYLVKNYPIYTSKIPLSAPVQSLKMVSAFNFNKSEIDDDLRQKSARWRCLQLVAI